MQRPQPERPDVQTFDSNHSQDETSHSFDLVVNDANNKHTYGGDRITIDKGLTVAQVAEAFNAAVDKIIDEGNGAKEPAPPGTVQEPIIGIGRTIANLARNRRNATQARRSKP